MKHDGEVPGGSVGGLVKQVWCRHQAVPKFTADGHTNMKYCMIFGCFLAAKDVNVVADAGEPTGVRPALRLPRNLKIPLIVCPSAVNIGRV